MVPIWILGLALLSGPRLAADPQVAGAGAKLPVSISITANATEFLRELVSTLNTYLRSNPQRDGLVRLRDLLAKLSGQEDVAAGYLEAALEEAQTPRGAT